MVGILEIRNLQKNFDAVKVINDFSLDVTEMTLCCLVGPNGAGKTTTMDLVTGRQKPTSGTVTFRSEEITGLGEHEIARRGLGRKFPGARGVPRTHRARKSRSRLQPRGERAAQHVQLRLEGLPAAHGRSRGTGRPQGPFEDAGRHAFARRDANGWRSAWC